MAKKAVSAYVKLQIPAGQATPAPPVGPALGHHGLNIAQFVKEFNDRTQKDMGLIIPVVSTVYKDRTNDFITNTPPAAVLLKKAVNLDKASGVPNREKVATVAWAECKRIAEMKMVDTNASDVESGARMVAGTARSMGIKIDYDA